MFGHMHHTYTPKRTRGTRGGTDENVWKKRGLLWRREKRILKQNNTIGRSKNGRSFAWFSVLYFLWRPQFTFFRFSFLFCVFVCVCVWRCVCIKVWCVGWERWSLESCCQTITCLNAVAFVKISQYQCRFGSSVCVKPGGGDGKVMRWSCRTVSGTNWFYIHSWLHYIALIPWWYKWCTHQSTSSSFGSWVWLIVIVCK